MKHLILCMLSALVLSANAQTKPEGQFKYVLHKANTRGTSEIAWLLSYHTFSFSDYYDPDRMNFGTLRVLNDDRIDGGKGFGTHPHNNMEIITIPLEGTVEHKDNMKNRGLINAGDVQIMSAGTGITHSEYNYSKSDTLRLLQIWVFPNQQNVQPRYQQKNGVLKNQPINTLVKVVSPNDTTALFLYQNAVFSVGKFKKNHKVAYPLAFKGNGVYAFIIKGKAKINGIDLAARDGLGIWNADKISIEASEDLQILLMDVPMID
ncbi:pirin family protein [Sporocytophaga myxococcoides]|uniref:pirin family protein n=1 Tax=Sporocytophaga myxococcoides TaxID=153721 RepID=UPI0003F51D54|nr:pirin family protein [Sporocytophaga myxococcoides]